MEHQLTQSVCRSLRDHAQLLIEEECSICEMCEVYPDGEINPLPRFFYLFILFFFGKLFLIEKTKQNKTKHTNRDSLPFKAELLIQQDRDSNCPCGSFFFQKRDPLASSLGNEEAKRKNIGFFFSQPIEK